MTPLLILAALALYVLLLLVALGFRALWKEEQAKTENAGEAPGGARPCGFVCRGAGVGMAGRGDGDEPGAGGAAEGERMSEPAFCACGKPAHVSLNVAPGLQRPERWERRCWECARKTPVVRWWHLATPGWGRGCERCLVVRRCPVCGGSGHVPAGFYLGTGPTITTSSSMPEQCRSCNGTGVVWHWSAATLCPEPAEREGAGRD